MTLAEVAARTGLLPQAISRAERAGIDLRVSTALTLAKAIGVPVCELLNEKVKHERDHKRRKRAAKR